MSATRYFSFHPALAAGPALDDLTLCGAATGLTQSEGTTLAHLGGAWRVLASDKHARRYPVFDLEMHEVGALQAPYPTNIPWPTLVPAHPLRSKDRSLPLRPMAARSHCSNTGR